MPSTSTNDTEFGNCYFDISKTDKRLIRATVKTFERTGTYVFLKLFKKAESDYEFQQRVSLTVQEFENLIEKSADIRSQFTEEESTKPPSPKKTTIPTKLRRIFVDEQKFLRRCTSAHQITLINFKNSSNFRLSKRNLPFLTQKFMQCVLILILGLVTNHYHVSLDTKTFEKETLKQSQNFPVPCIFTSATTLETNGDVFAKLNLAVEFNSSADKVDSQTVRKQLPGFVYNDLKNSNAKQVSMNQKPGAKMPVVAQKLSTTPVLHRNKFKLIFLIVKLSEELKTFCLVLFLVLFV